MPKCLEAVALRPELELVTEKTESGLYKVR